MILLLKIMNRYKKIHELIVRTCTFVTDNCVQPSTTFFGKNKLDSICKKSTGVEIYVEEKEIEKNVYQSIQNEFEFDSDESDIESCETVKKSVVDNDFFDMQYFDSEIDV